MNSRLALTTAAIKQKHFYYQIKDAVISNHEYLTGKQTAFILDLAVASYRGLGMRANLVAAEKIKLRSTAISLTFLPSYNG